MENNRAAIAFDTLHEAKDMGHAWCVQRHVVSGCGDGDWCAVFSSDGIKDGTW